MRSGIERYIKTWERRGYPGGIPDEVPDALMRECLAPSYKAICFAILKNDHCLQSLGYSPKKNALYMHLKKLEFEAEGRVPSERQAK